MAVRHFDGVDDFITLSPGGVTANGAYTIVAIVKPAVLSSGLGYLSARGGTPVLASMGDGGAGRLATYTALLGSGADVSKTADEWQFLVSTKASGTNHPRFHRKVIGSGSWTHVNGADDNIPNDATAVTAVLIGTIPGSPFQGRYALAAFLSGVNLSDADVESIETYLTTQRIVDLGAGGAEVWELNQDNSGQPVESLSGTSDQTTITGTDVVTGDDPPGWVYGLTGPPVTAVAPVVSGTTQVEFSLTTTHGAWTGSPAPTYAYQWERDAGTGYVEISAATSSTYELVEDDIACMVRCVVTATNTEGSAAQASNALGPIAPVPPLTFTVRLSGGASNAVPALSLGGAESSEEAGADLYPTVTGDQGQDGFVTYRLVYLHNDDSASGTAVAWINMTLSGSAYLAIGAALEDAGDDVSPVADEETPPAGVTFSTPITVEAGVSLGEVAPGEGKGVWIRRTIPPSTDADTSNPARIVFTITPPA